MKHLFTGLCLALSSCAIFADDVERMPVTEGLELTEQEIAHAEAIATSSLSPALYGGREAAADELPSSVNVSFCTYNIVGTTSLLYAGHCGQTGSRASFVYKGVKHTASCTRHPNYNDRTLFNDFGMCVFSPAITDKIWATISNRAPEVSEIVVLNGYGRGSPGGRLNLAKLPIARLNGSQEIFTQNSKIFLGGGDSSGGLFYDFDLKDMSKALIIGVNSRAGSGLSIFNRVDHPEAQSFFKSWASANNQKVCGINLNCYEGVAPPPPPSVPEHCKVEKLMYESMLAKAKKFETYLKNCK
jgi:hypothetical protein